ncbi:hypothetical protein CEXT_490221 [Caerostris extrusa]|uniref:Uncharacterized protein n=1 Tax=Caerostris extrusa TaxID=172846 RepID=A0AAV4W5R9_CAEEX|nr:hypothetical protein CEXT_490221 [Caerostris extrusa]
MMTNHKHIALKRKLHITKYEELKTKRRIALIRRSQEGVEDIFPVGTMIQRPELATSSFTVVAKATATDTLLNKNVWITARDSNYKLHQVKTLVMETLQYPTENRKYQNEYF